MATEVKSTPWTAYVVNPGELRCTFEPHQSNQKERDHTWKDMAFAWYSEVKKQKNTKKVKPRTSWHVVSTHDRQVKSWKKVSFFSIYLNRITRLKKRWIPRTACTLFNTSTDKVRTEKRPTACTLLRRIIKLKNVNSEIRSKAQDSYLERYSPKGSCHHDESSMSHTLAQNNHCEFCCGMHLACKNTPVSPDRTGSMKGPEKQWKLSSP